MKYSCEYCNYYTLSSKDYNKHLLTKKHIQNTNKKDSSPKIEE